MMILYLVNTALYYGNIVHIHSIVHIVLSRLCVGTEIPLVRYLGYTCA